jgi:hypothetical protein
MFKFVILFFASWAVIALLPKILIAVGLAVALQRYI